MKKTLFFSSLVATAILLNGCANPTPSGDIRAIKTDTKPFERRSCSELSDRLAVLNEQERELSQEQDKDREESYYMKVLGDGSVARYIAHLRGEKNAINEVFTKKGCHIKSVSPTEQTAVVAEKSESAEKTDVVKVEEKKDTTSEKTGGVKPEDQKVVEKIEQKDTSKEKVKAQKVEEAKSLTSKEKTSHEIEGWRIKSVETVPLTGQKEGQKVGTQKEKQVCPLEGKSSDKGKQACLLDGQSPNQKDGDKKDKVKKEEAKKTIDKKDATKEIRDDPALLNSDQKVEEKVEKKIVSPIEKKELIQKTKDSTEKTVADKPKDSAILEAFKAKQKKTEATKDVKEAKETPLKVTEKVKKKEKPKVKQKAKSTNNFYRGRFGRYN